VGISDRPKEMIIRNSAQCGLCGEEVESESVHDFKWCGCGEIFVDGGRNYLRRGARDLTNFIDTSMVVERSS
jgi:hypothetical protein